jgi:Icc-related predicted phosphoesterase
VIGVPSDFPIIRSQRIFAAAAMMPTNAMRIRVLSDLHREFGHLPLPDMAADVVVLAGDIDRGSRGVAWARTSFPNTPVLYVAGNHEHYDERIGRLHEKLRESAAGTNVHVLENETFKIGGYRFFGATLWTDFNLLNDRVTAIAAAGSKERGMNDYRKIRRKDTGRLQPHHTAMLHADSRLALTRFLTSGDRTRSVVITHHAPSIRSLPEHKRTEPISAAYASNLEDLIVTQGPALWVHGHIHRPCDYLIGATRIVNNAFGYLDGAEIEGRGFRGDLVIEL